MERQDYPDTQTAISQLARHIGRQNGDIGQIPPALLEQLEVGDVVAGRGRTNARVLRVVGTPDNKYLAYGR